jgi:hypothetical protein
MLWKTEAHPLLFRAGLSLENSRLSEAAVTYWQSMAAAQYTGAARTAARSGN